MSRLAVQQQLRDDVAAKAPFTAATSFLCCCPGSSSGTTLRLDPALQQQRRDDVAALQDQGLRGIGPERSVGQRLGSPSVRGGLAVATVAARAGCAGDGRHLGFGGSDSSPAQERRADQGKQARGDREQRPDPQVGEREVDRAVPGGLKNHPQDASGKRDHREQPSGHPRAEHSADDYQHTGDHHREPKRPQKGTGVRLRPVHQTGKCGMVDAGSRARSPRTNPPKHGPNGDRDAAQ